MGVVAVTIWQRLGEGATVNERNEQETWIFGAGGYDPERDGTPGSIDGEGAWAAPFAPPSWSAGPAATAGDAVPDDTDSDAISSAELVSAATVAPPVGQSFAAPTTQSRPSRKVVVATAIAVALVVVSAAASFAANGSDSSTNRSYGAPAITSSTDPGSWPTDGTTDPGERPYSSDSTSSAAEASDSSTDPTDSDGARARLEQLADKGLAEVAFDGQDVAMIASKWDGITDPLQEAESGGHVFGYLDILAEHERLASGDNLGARLVLLRGSDYGKRLSSPDGQTIYVTFALDSFPDLAAVKDWCNERFASLSKTKRENSCVATKLTS